MLSQVWNSAQGPCDLRHCVPRASSLGPPNGPLVKSGFNTLKVFSSVVLVIRNSTKHPHLLASGPEVDW